MKLNKKQRAAVQRIIRRLETNIAHNGVERIESFKLESLVGNGLLVAVRFETQRNDCERYSQRAVLTETSGHAIINHAGTIKLSRWLKRASTIT